LKTYKISENELDERLELDKRKNHRAFCICFKTLEEAPDGFYDLQRKISDGLEHLFRANFDDGVDRSHLKPWQMWQHNFFCFNGDMFGSERIVVEMSKEILADKMIGLVLAHLEKTAPSYCLTADVYESMERQSQFLGRFVINLDEIAVEESLADIWSRHVKFMEIENLPGR
jgi:hypothetical protein